MSVLGISSALSTNSPLLTAKLGGRKPADWEESKELALQKKDFYFCGTIPVQKEGILLSHLRGPIRGGGGSLQIVEITAIFLEEISKHQTEKERKHGVFTIRKCILQSRMIPLKWASRLAFAPCFPPFFFFFTLMDEFKDLFYSFLPFIKCGKMGCHISGSENGDSIEPCRWFTSALKLTISQISILPYCIWLY